MSRKKQPKQANEVHRKIYFFGYKILKDSEGTPADPSEVFRYIASLSFEGGKRYLADEKDPSKETVIVRCDQFGQKIIGSIASVRRGALPSVEKRGTGKIRPLVKLYQDDGIAELTHFVFYMDDGVLAVEYNHHGPRATTVAHYIERTSDPNVLVVLDYVTNKDFQKRLQQIDQNEIRVLRMRVPVDRIAYIEKFDQDLFAALKSAEALGESEEIELVFRSPRGSRAKISPIQRLKAIGNAIVGNGNEEGGNIFSSLRLTAKQHNEEGVREFDLLEEHFVSSIQVIAEEGGTRMLNSEHVLAKIDAAYSTRREEILKTLGV